MSEFQEIKKRGGEEVQENRVSEFEGVSETVRRGLFEMMYKVLYKEFEESEEKRRKEVINSEDN